MSTISPIVADAFHLLQDNLYGHLDEAEFLAEKNGDWSGADTDTARKLIPDLVLVIRGLLIEHEIQDDGECQTCSSAWPCAVVATIHAFVKDPQQQFVELVRRTHGTAARECA